MESEVSHGPASGNEVPVVARRRHHTRSYKLKVLAQADRCARETLYDYADVYAHP